MLSSKKDFIIIDYLHVFPLFSGILVKFSIKIGDFGFDFDKISLSGITETS